MEATVKEISTGKIIRGPSPATEDNDKIWMGAIKPALSAESCPLLRNRAMLSDYDVAHVPVGEPVPTPDQVRGRLSPEHALAELAKPPPQTRQAIA
jgi:hypothetical protein